MREVKTEEKREDNEDNAKAFEPLFCLVQGNFNK